MVTSRRSDNFHEVKDRLQFYLIFIVLGYPVEQRWACALKYSKIYIEMYAKWALGAAKTYSGCSYACNIQ